MRNLIPIEWIRCASRRLQEEQRRHGSTLDSIRSKWSLEKHRKFLGVHLKIDFDLLISIASPLPCLHKSVMAILYALYSARKRETV